MIEGNQNPVPMRGNQFLAYRELHANCHNLFIFHIAFFKEFELVGKFFKRATKNLKMLCDHALQTHIQSRLRLLHADNFKIILALKKQLNL